MAPDGSPGGAHVAIGVAMRHGSPPFAAVRCVRSASAADGGERRRAAADRLPPHAAVKGSCVQEREVKDDEA